MDFLFEKIDMIASETIRTVVTSSSGAAVGDAALNLDPPQQVIDVGEEVNTRSMFDCSTL